MGNLLLQSVLYGLAAAAAAPVAAVVTALILSKSERPIPSALAFTAGAASLAVVLGLIFLWLFNDDLSSGSDLGAWIDVTLGVLFGLLGIKAIFTKESPEAEAAKRARAEGIATGGLRKLFGAGVVVAVINSDALAVFLGGVKEAAEADVSTGQAAIAILVCLAFMLVPYYGPALMYLVAPERATPLLGRMIEWVFENSRAIEIVVGLAFGAAFLSKGIAGLS